MKKCMLFVLIFCTVTVFGQDVSQSLAVDIATQYYEQVKNDNLSEYISTIKSYNLSKSNREPERVSVLGLAHMWLVPVDDGWVLVSSNTKTTPILAHYQTKHKPEFKSLAGGEKFLLEWYEHEIAFANDSCPNCERNRKWDYLRQNKSQSRANRSTPVVSALIQTHWKQTGNNDSIIALCDKSYNKFCPPANNVSICNKSPVGCVAVAMAQIMRYWEWPYAADIPTTSGGWTKEVHFFDWSKMPKYIYNSTPTNNVDMVASFLKDCGYALSMNYNDSSSSALSTTAFGKFKEFGYNKDSISWHLKEPTNNWEEKIKYELNLGRPVFYSGTPDTFDWGGHVFVVDGYDSENKFHINFGWGGDEDKFYCLDSINTGNGSYNHWHYAIWGIQPDPICTAKYYDESFSPNTKFCIAIGGDVEMNGCILENIEQGEIYSSSEIRLTNGFTIRQGCNVHIAIRNVPCQPTTASGAPPIQSALLNRKVSGKEHVAQQQKNTFAISPNPVNAILQIQTSEELAQVNIYNLNGQCVMRAAQTDIDVSALPQGMYILRAVTIDSIPLQAKFIKQ